MQKLRPKLEPNALVFDAHGAMLNNEFEEHEALRSGLKVAQLANI